VRLFLAARLPESLLKDLLVLRADWVDTLGGWRFLPPEDLHVTLRFLGETASAPDLLARPAWTRVVAEARPFRCALTRAGRFPERGSARVLWVGLEEREPGAALGDLARRLEQAARAHGFAPEERPFHPHVTLARARRGARPDLPPLEPLSSRGEGWVREVVLFESRVAPGGARYTALETFPLGASTLDA
jgi:2'-5' RNA ligase